MKVILSWFSINSFQANPGKIKFMIWKKKFELIVNSTEIEEIKKVVLLGISSDNLLTFNQHIDNLSLQRIRNYLSLEKDK